MQVTLYYLCMQVVIYFKQDPTPMLNTSDCGDDDDEEILVLWPIHRQTMMDKIIAIIN